MRILIYILLAFCSVACMSMEPTDPGADPKPNPDVPNKPVQPIKRRPVTPDELVMRPRYSLVVDLNSTIIFNGNFGTARPMSVEVYSVTTGRTFSAVLRYEGDALEIPSELLGEEFTITTECDDIVYVELCTLGEE